MPKYSITYQKEAKVFCINFSDNKNRVVCFSPNCEPEILERIEEIKGAKVENFIVVTEGSAHVNPQLTVNEILLSNEDLIKCNRVIISKVIFEKTIK